MKQCGTLGRCLSCYNLASCDKQATVAGHTGVRGALNWQYGFFDGLIDEIRIWDTARTEQEIQFYKNLPLTGDEPGLIAYWNFDEGGGQMFFDQTVNGSHGYLGFGPEEEEFDPLWVESDVPIEYRRVDNYDNGTPSVPATFLLSQNYPNPFNAETQISFSLPTRSAVRIDIYDMLGRRVNTLVDAHMDAGVHRVVWNGRSESGESLSSGIYIYRMNAGQFTDSKKMLIVK